MRRPLAYYMKKVEGWEEVPPVLMMANGVYPPGEEPYNASYVNVKLGVQVTATNLPNMRYIHVSVSPFTSSRPDQSRTDLATYIRQHWREIVDQFFGKEAQFEEWPPNPKRPDMKNLGMQVTWAYQDN